jgi:hypothetical protein
MKRNVRARTGQEVQPWADSERGGGSEKVPLRSQSVGAGGYMNVHVDFGRTLLAADGDGWGENDVVILIARKFVGRGRYGTSSGTPPRIVSRPSPAFPCSFRARLRFPFSFGPR